MKNLCHCAPASEVQAAPSSSTHPGPAPSSSSGSAAADREEEGDRAASYSPAWHGFYTGISSQTSTKLRDESIGKCYFQSVQFLDDSKTLYRQHDLLPPILLQGFECVRYILIDVSQGTIHKGHPQIFWNFEPPTIFGCIFSRSIVTNPRNFSHYACFWFTPSCSSWRGRSSCILPPQDGRRTNGLRRSLCPTMHISYEIT